MPLPANAPPTRLGLAILPFHRFAASSIVVPYQGQVATAFHRLVWKFSLSSIVVHTYFGSCSEKKKAFISDPVHKNINLIQRYTLDPLHTKRKIAPIAPNLAPLDPGDVKKIWWDLNSIQPHVATKSYLRLGWEANWVAPDINLDSHSITSATTTKRTTGLATTDARTENQ